MSTNWLIDAIDLGNGIQERKHCFVRFCPDSPTLDEQEEVQEHSYTLCDYDTGGSVLGEFLNTYGYWSTAEAARAAAVAAGYKCDPADDDC